MSAKNRRKNSKSNHVKNWERPARFDLGLVQAVKERDGDNCRRCGGTVIWADRRGSRGGRLFHLDAQHPPRVWSIVVACNECSQSPYWRNEVVTRLIDENLDPSLVKKKDRGWLKVDGKSSEPAPEPKPDLQDSYWVQVSPDTAGWLEGRGLMMAHLMSVNGEPVQEPVVNRSYQPGLLIKQVLATPFPVPAKEAERPSVPTDCSGVANLGVPELREQGFIEDHVRVQFISRDGSSTCDGECDDGAKVRSDGKVDGVIRFFFEPFIDPLDKGHSHCGGCSESGVTVDRDDHKTSPSVGAPNGAVGDTSNPIGGDGAGVSGAKPETPGVNIQVTASPGMSADNLVYLLEHRLLSLLDPLRIQH